MFCLFNLLFINVISLKNTYVNKVVQLYPFFSYQILYSILSYKIYPGASNLMYCSWSFLGRLNRIWRYVTLSRKSNLSYVQFPDKNNSLVFLMVKELQMTFVSFAFAPT